MKSWRNLKVPLKGLSYEPLFEFFVDLKQDGGFKIYNDDYVTTDNGTGIVHWAPSFGEDDNRVMSDAGVRLELCLINEKGEFNEPSNRLCRSICKNADKNIIKQLKEKLRLYEQSVIVHLTQCVHGQTHL